MKPTRQQKDREYLQDILEIITEIEQIVESNDRRFIIERALERCFEIIGEACRRVSAEMKSEYPDIPWNRIVNLRNIITHEYDVVKIETLWEFAEHKIPALKDWISGILKQHEGGGYDAFIIWHIAINSSFNCTNSDCVLFAATTG